MRREKGRCLISLLDIWVCVLLLICRCKQNACADKMNYQRCLSWASVSDERVEDIDVMLVHSKVTLLEPSNSCGNNIWTSGRGKCGFGLLLESGYELIAHPLFVFLWLGVVVNRFLNQCSHYYGINTNVNI